MTTLRHYALFLRLSDWIPICPLSRLTHWPSHLHLHTPTLIKSVSLWKHIRMLHRYLRCTIWVHIVGLTIVTYNVSLFALGFLDVYVGYASVCNWESLSTHCSLFKTWNGCLYLYITFLGWEEWSCSIWKHFTIQWWLFILFDFIEVVMTHVLVDCKLVRYSVVYLGLYRLGCLLPFQWRILRWSNHHLFRWTRYSHNLWWK